MKSNFKEKAVLFLAICVLAISFTAVPVKADFPLASTIQAQVAKPIAYKL